MVMAHTSKMFSYPKWIIIWSENQVLKYNIFPRIPELFFTINVVSFLCNEYVVYLYMGVQKYAYVQNEDLLGVNLRISF